MSISFSAKLKKQSPTLIAVLIFLGSTAAAVYAYGSILDREQTVASRFPEIVAGSHHLSFSSQQGCFGYLQVEVPQTIESFPKISYQGNFSLQYKGNLLPVAVDGDLSFNSLGQLGGSIFSFSVSGAKLQVASLDINPIRLIIKLIKDGQISRHQLLLPGPIELQVAASGNYRLFYPGLVNVKTAGLEDLAGNILKAMKKSINVAVADKNDIQCSEENLQSFDLTPYLISMEKFISSAEIFLGS